MELPGSHIGPRARLLNIYCRGHLGVSLGKSCDLLEQWWGISLSRAGALGHLAWGRKLFDPVVTRLLELLREALGDSLPGVLVCDFYAAYNFLNAKKQRCLTHLLRELHGLREKVPPICVKKHLQPLSELFQESIALAKRRTELAPAAYARRCDAIYQRYAELATAPSSNAHVLRIQKRLDKYADEVFTFLEEPHVPPDNTPAERDIRSVAAARADGGVNRTDWGAEAFAHAKSIIRTCQKQGCNFLQYGLEVVRALSAGRAPPLPQPLSTS